MEFKEKLISSHLAFEDVVDLIRKPSCNQEFMRLKFLREKGFPTKKDEAWKYTSLVKLS